MEYSEYDEDSKDNERKMCRQLGIFYSLVSYLLNRPNDFMIKYNIGRRTLERDLKDLSDAGIMHIEYSRKYSEYTAEETNATDAVINVKGTRRLAHLERLRRLCTLIRHFMEDFKTDTWDLWDYEEDDDYYNIQVYDLAKEYHSLFPGSDERKRQRDFKTLNEAGFHIEYLRKLKGYIFTIDNDYFI